MNKEEARAFSKTITGLYNLDRQDNGSRLYDFTIAYNNGEIDEMARPKGSKNGVRKAESETEKPLAKPATATGLLEALSFIAVAGTKDDVPYKKHVILNNGYAVCHNGILTAGFPIIENLECCPHLDLLTKALKKCGQELAITENENGSLSIKGEKLRATIPCIPFTELPIMDHFAPSPSVAAIDDRLKQAFEVCGPVVSETGLKMIESAIHLQANFCTACDGKMGVQYWHGIDLPPDLIIPKMFIQAVAKCKYKLVGFGYVPGTSITFWFENKAFLKTNLYNDKYPIDSVNRLLNVSLNPIDIPKDFFEAFSVVSEFSGENTAEVLDGKVFAKGENTIEADYKVDNLKGDVVLNNEYIKLIEPYAKKFDITSDKEKVFFFGENVRGMLTVIVKHISVPVKYTDNVPVSPPVNDDDIPF